MRSLSTLQKKTAPQRRIIKRTRPDLTSSMQKQNACLKFCRFRFIPIPRKQVIFTDWQNLMYSTCRKRIRFPEHPNYQKSLHFPVLGRINASISTQLVFDEDKYVIISYVNYKKEPEYIWDIGNTITDDPGQDIINRFVFAGTALRQVKKDFYVGVPFDVSDYFDIQADSNSVLLTDGAVGLNGGTSIGLGVAAAYDTRKNRYNPLDGSYILGTAIFYPGSWGPYAFSKFCPGCPEIHQSL